jgi:hypothetical protein
MALSGSGTRRCRFSFVHSCIANWPENWPEKAAEANGGVPLARNPR